VKPVSGTWGEVLEGEYVQDKTGKTWKVTRLTASVLEMVDREGKEMRTRPPQPEARVTRMVLTPEEAGPMINRVLGPVTPVTVEGQPALRIEAFNTRPLHAMRSHLKMFHGIDGSGVSDNRSRKDAIEAHDFAHSRNNMLFNHVHIGEGEST